MSASPTIGPMSIDRLARRDLALAAVVVVGLSRLVEPPVVWLVAILLLGATLLGVLQVLGDEAARSGRTLGVPVESLIIPSVAAIACVGAIRLVPFGLWLAPALLLTYVIVGRSLALEARLASADDAPIDDDARASVLVTVLLVGFLGFVGVGATVLGGLAQPGAEGAAGGPLRESDLIALAAGDAVIAALLGFRVAALRLVSVRDVLWSAATYGAAIAIGAAAVRAMEIPRLLGPALLTLAFYLWDAVHGATPARRREARWIWQTALLGILGVAVIAWNLLLRG